MYSFILDGRIEISNLISKNSIFMRCVICNETIIQAQIIDLLKKIEYSVRLDEIWRKIEESITYHFVLLVNASFAYIMKINIVDERINAYYSMFTSSSSSVEIICVGVNTRCSDMS